MNTITITIRKDLQSVEALISRLLSLGKEFEAMDSRWVHMKHEEDFEKIWMLEDKSKQYKIENVYAKGRDMGLFMTKALFTINYDFSTYPTLTAIIDRFKDTWIDQDLSGINAEAKEAHDSLGLDNWAFNQMLGMFDDQIELGKAVRQTLNLLKNTGLYKQENGINIVNEEHKQSHATIIAAKITGIAVLAAAIITGTFLFFTNNSTQNININDSKETTVITGDDNLVDKK
jgi:hypothetical protein